MSQQADFLDCLVQVEATDRALAAELSQPSAADALQVIWYLDFPTSSRQLVGLNFKHSVDQEFTVCRWFMILIMYSPQSSALKVLETLCTA